MDLWYTEQHSDDVRFSIRVTKQLYDGESNFQHVAVFESEGFGRIMTLDGMIMVTEKDEFIYHDMIVHVPMAAKPGAKNVLVIGGGDGGTVRELTRYGGIERIDMVEIDSMVVDVSRKLLPQLSCRLDDPRVSIHYEDGLRFVRSKQDLYDLIIVDSTDPIGPGEGLFTKEFYGSCFKALNSDGVLVNQHESPYYDDYAKAMMRAHKRINELFPICRVYQAHIPTYPSGHWLFGFASKSVDPVDALDADAWNRLGIQTRYYNTDLHKGAFALPNYVLEMLDKVDV